MKLSKRCGDSEKTYMYALVKVMVKSDEDVKEEVVFRKRGTMDDILSLVSEKKLMKSDEGTYEREIPTQGPVKLYEALSVENDADYKEVHDYLDKHVNVQNS